jgi:hypothetical protein
VQRPHIHLAHGARLTLSIGDSSQRGAPTRANALYPQRPQRAASARRWRDRRDTAGRYREESGATGAQRARSGRRPLRRRRLFKRRNEPCDATVLAAGNHLERLVIVKRGDRLAQPHGDVARIHDPRQALHQRRQLDEALRPPARRAPRASKPSTRGTRSRTGGPRNIGGPPPNPQPRPGTTKRWAILQRFR